MYATHAVISTLTLKSEFHKSKLDSIEKDFNEWISYWKGSEFKKTKFWSKGSINNNGFMIHMLNNLPQEYDVTLDGLKNSCTSSGPDALTI